jgi:hypothetical protein
VRVTPPDAEIGHDQLQTRSLRTITAGVRYRGRAGGIPGSPPRCEVRCSDVALVDPDDDPVTRYVIWHYRSDSARHERRSVTVAAYDYESEFTGEIERLRAGLKLRQAAGDADAVEPLSGTVERPGHGAEQRQGRSERPFRGRTARVRKRG